MPDELYTIDNNTTWVNKHENVSKDIEATYILENPEIVNGDPFPSLRKTISAIQEILSKAAEENTTVRAYGSKWSLSDCAVTSYGKMLHTKNLNWSFFLKEDSVSVGYAGNHKDLFWAQSGCTVRIINESLKKRKRSLKACGGSNGQTIAGATSTGTHGSAFEFGSLHDSIVGIQLITSYDRCIWLERASYPVVSNDFASKLGAEIIRDDTLFNAALVSFGSFGFIFSMMIETEPIYLLRMERSRIPLDDNLRETMDTLDFSKIPEIIKGHPYHFEVVINPHDVDDGAYVTAMYKKAYHTKYTPPKVISTGLGPGDDLLAVVGTIGEILPGSTSFIMKAFADQLYKEKLIYWGTLGEIFHATDAIGAATSVEIGIPLEFASAALDMILEINNEKESFPGFFCFRYVKKSNALLAFTKFDITCTIEFPATLSDSALAFYGYLWDEFENSDIPYTFHWGQANNLTNDKVVKMYGNDAELWVQSRNALLNETYRKVFSNDFLDRSGLNRSMIES